MIFLMVMLGATTDCSLFWNQGGSIRLGLCGIGNRGLSDKGLGLVCWRF
jgi:hypothetical protein